MGSKPLTMPWILYCAQEGSYSWVLACIIVKSSVALSTLLVSMLYLILSVLFDH